MARNLSEYEIVKQERNLVKIEYDEALRVKELALSLADQPGMHSIVDQNGIEHVIGYASSLIPGRHESMGSEIQELYIQSHVTPLYEGETIAQSWHAVMSFHSYDERFAGDSSVRHVYDVDAVENEYEGVGSVLGARHRVFAIRDAPYEGFSSARNKTVGYSFRGHGIHKALLETAMLPEHVERLEERTKRALKRLASTSFRLLNTGLLGSAGETIEVGADVIDHPRPRSVQFAFMPPVTPGDPFKLMANKE